jgi:thiaminase
LDELKLHEDACARWGVDDGALETIHPASRAYVDFLTALQSPDVPMDELVAGMTPCMRLYAALGRDYLDRGLVAEGCAYREWFDAYGGDEMGALAASLEALLPEVRSIQTFVFHPSTARFQHSLDRVVPFQLTGELLSYGTALIRSTAPEADAAARASLRGERRPAAATREV